MSRRYGISALTASSWLVCNPVSRCYIYNRQIRKQSTTSICLCYSTPRRTFFGWSALPLRHASHKQPLIVFRCFFDDHGTLAPLRWMRQPEPFSLHGKGVPQQQFIRPAASAPRTGKARVADLHSMMPQCGAIHLVPRPAPAPAAGHIPGLPGYLVGFRLCPQAGPHCPHAGRSGI